MNWTLLSLGMAMSFLTGSIPSAYLYVRIKTGKDIRTMGSGNPGATNVYRTVGKTAAFVTLIFDIFKGYACVTFLARAVYQETVGIPPGLYVALVGVTVVAGHNWTVFLHGKGGKGIATSAGVLLGLCPLLLLIGLVTWVVVFAASRVVSIASLAAAAIIPAATLLVPTRMSIQLLTLALSVLTLYRHKENIHRLLRGEEKELKVKI